MRTQKDKRPSDIDSSPSVNAGTHECGAKIAAPSGETETLRLLHELQVHQVELKTQNEELRRAEEEAKGYAAELAAIYENAPFVMILLDTSRRVRKVNGFATAFTNRSADELVGLRGGEALRCLHALDDPQGCGFGPSCRECLIRKTVMDTLEAGRVHHQVEINLTSNVAGKRERHVFLLSSVPLIVQGAPMALVGFLDITDRKLAEEERERLTVLLRQSEKMSVVGQLAGGIAHNFNNQLSGIIGYADLLLARTEDKSLHHYIAGIHKAASRSAELTEQLLAFARKGQYLSMPMDMHHLIGETVSLLSSTIDPRISIRQHFDAECGTIKGDPTQIQNMLLNLGLNARDAMPAGGVIVFATSTVELVGQQALDLNVGAGRYLCVSVDDSGTGMDPDTMDHLFEPFFTTKDTGKGTGLGLAAVYGTVLNHHGAIEVRSETGKGATFTIYLPLSERKVPVRESEPAREVVKGHGRILLADDESVVLDIGTDMLRNLGYEVTACADGADAVARYRECWRNIDLVILDVVMPEMSGRDAFTAMRRINPDVKVLISSGYSLEGEVRAILDDGAIAFLPKPYNCAELSCKVAEALRI